MTLASLPLIATVVSLIGLAGGAIGFFQAQRSKAIIDTQRLSIDSLEKRMEIQGLDFTQCKERLAQAEGTMAALSDQVTGTSAVAVLTKTVVENHHQVMKLIRAQRKSLLEVKK